MSQGQATRSTFTRSRVTHFMSHLLSVARDSIVALNLSELHESMARRGINSGLFGGDQPRFKLLLALPDGNDEPVALTIGRPQDPLHQDAIAAPELPVG